MKLPLHEPESEALLLELAEWEGHVASVLLGVEAIRACGRYGERYVADARSFLLDVALLPLDDAVLDRAGSIDPTGLRSLDALHLATALSIKDDLGTFISYDERLASAAADHGFSVMQPS